MLLGVIPQVEVLNVGVLDVSRNTSLLREKLGVKIPSKLYVAIPGMEDGVYGKSMSQALLSILMWIFSLA